MALNGGPHFTLTEAVSMVVYCDGQAEIDRPWDVLLAHGGREQRCGWLKDRCGLSWQVVPSNLREIMRSPDPVKVSRVTGPVMTMVKPRIAKLEAAYRGN